jgi:hypothetical protein
MPVSRTMWLRGLNEDYGKMKFNAREERDDQIKVITQKWRDGYKLLKEENDRMQKENEDKYKAELAELLRSHNASLAQGPPTD